MLSMLHRLVNQSSHQVHFMHVCENGDLHAFGHEVLELASRRSGVHALFWYRAALEHDRQKMWSYTEGFLTRDQLQRHLPLDDYDFYLCGPSGFMQANYALLRQLGVTVDRIHYEFFGPATILEQTIFAETKTASSVSAKPVAAASLSKAFSDNEAALEITFLPNGLQTQWQEGCESF